MTTLQALQDRVLALQDMGGAWLRARACSHAEHWALVAAVHAWRMLYLQDCMVTAAPLPERPCMALARSEWPLQGGAGYREAQHRRGLRRLQNALVSQRLTRRMVAAITLWKASLP